ncbi:MAG: sugar ABC transporter permease [Chloroflexi bacterium]|nr:MAG: sugar ABC transporter permease [Chloroflexota bacterium]
MTAIAGVSARSRSDRGGRFLVPLVAVMALTSIYPAVYSLIYSLFDWNWGQRLNFVGLANYVDVLASDRFRTALVNTVVFTVSAVSVELLLGLGLAVAVNRVGRGGGFVRTLLLLPLMVSGIIVSVAWKILLDPTVGLVGYGAEVLGFPRLGFLGDPGMAMGSIVLIDTWWQTAFVFIVLAAGLRALPAEPLEAAEVDGASAWQRFRYVALPLLRPVILIVLLFRTIDCMKVFAIIFGTTGGGPLTTTESVQVLAYRTAFKQLNMSVSMTMMVIFTVIVLGIVLAYQRLGAGRELTR